MQIRPINNDWSNSFMVGSKDSNLRPHGPKPDPKYCLQNEMLFV
jgi:hypothetical protein